MRHYIYILAVVLIFTACFKTDSPYDSKPRVVASTSIIADIARNVGGEFVQVESLMGPDIDPHQYKASEGDVLKLASANIIFHNGLHLEGKLGEVLQKARGAIPTFAVTDSIPLRELIYTGNVPDPHVWFDPHLWLHAVTLVADGLAEIDPDNELYYRRNEEKYVRELMELNERIIAKLNTVPEEKRILVTSHDAFSYFGKAYGWEVIGIQGINTASETSVYSIQNLARKIVNKNITCLFTETSVSGRSIDALTASVHAMGGHITKGRPLYSDALGAPETGADTYIKMIEYNVNSIVDGIIGKQDAQ